MSYTPIVRPSIQGEHGQVARDIDDFERSKDRFVSGQTPEAVFLEYRLRHGVYGMRQDGVHMMRSKLPLGLISPEQMEAFGDVAERYGHGISHLTTRQDIQVHFIELNNTPDLMRVLNDAAMTSREACGNVVRNVCASPMSGVLPGEAFDVTAHGMALARYLLVHPDGQGLGRKFKITLSSSFDPNWNLATIHDIGATAVINEAGERGFHIVVGGGLGAVPHEAQVYKEFVPENELLPVSLAVLRLFAKHGEKRNRARARLKFVVAKFGIEAFRDMIDAEVALLQDDPRWAEFDHESYRDVVVHGPSTTFPEPRDEEDAQWLRTNTFRQHQEGYSAVRVRVPRGDLDPDQLRGLASLLRDLVGDTTRIGWDQSLIIRSVAWDKLLELRDGLKALGLGKARSGGIADPVTCPGADTCKLGITSPRSVARFVENDLDALATDPRLEDLRIHISGCPNSCAQHQIADIGFFGAAKKVGGNAAPHFMLMLGGLRGGVGDGVKLGSGFGQASAKVPAARMGETIAALTRAFLEQAEEGEAFGTFARRKGRHFFKELLTPLMAIPTLEEAPEYYREFGKDEAFVVKRGKGECEGEVVELSDLLLQEADREADAAHDLLADEADKTAVHARARKAMDFAARALLSTNGLVNPSEFDLVGEFKKNWYDKALIFEGVGHYYLAASSEDPTGIDDDRLRRAVVEAGLFVEEAHTILGRLQQTAAK